jgi:hypothetical protein
LRYLGEAAQRADVDSATRSARPVVFVIASRRDAMFTVPVDRVLDLPRRADVPRHEVPAVQPDAHGEAVAQAVLVEPAVEARESHFEHLARRRVEGPVGVVLGRDGCAEGGEDAVAA